MEEEFIRQEAVQRPEARSDPRLDWWRDAKFGLFIHWGLYAVPAGTWRGEKIAGIGEWIMKRAQIPVTEYEQLAEEFNPVEFDADAWVKMAKDAGQRYIVITSKHHDGFCMYHSQVTDYNIVDATPFDRDPIAELVEACRRHGLKLGFYYSQTQDWHHPNGDGNNWDYVEEEKDFDSYVENYVKEQVRELLTRYGPICLIWFDTPKRMTEAQSRSLLALVHELQPDCLVSGRVGNSLGDYTSTRDNKIPPVAVETDFETPATINETWGFKDYDHNWKSIEDMTKKLVDIVSKGGNYLLNVGPTAEGVIPKASIGRLLGIGAWLDVNGESVYGTRPGPIQGLDWCRSTVKGNRLFLHVFEWPEGGLIALDDESGHIERAYLLGDPAQEPLPITTTDDIIEIQGPITAPDPIDTVVVLE
ncbi:MAG: alpha-L-fucosidase [Anaerolineae bacterium]